MSGLDQLQILLLQSRRPDDPARAHETACFVSKTGLAADQIVVHDLSQGPPPFAQVRRFDALMMGGAGDYDVSRRNLPQMDALLGLLREVVATGHPTYASCFGYQCIVQALGGEVAPDYDAVEVGTYRVSLTEAGRQDELFRGLKPVFWGQLGHKERAVREAPGTVNLAGTEASPLQALRIPGQPIWASQFHPELDREANLHRLRLYRPVYRKLMSAEECDAMAERFRDGETDHLLGAFLELVFGAGAAPRG